MGARLASPTRLRLRNGALALAQAVATAPGGVGAATVITLVDIDKNQRTFQRDSANKKSIAVLGTSDGTAPIQARALDADTGAVIVDWTTVATPAAGTFAGSLDVQASRKAHRLEVRDAINHAVTAAGVNRFFVGAIWLKVGQSNTVNMPTTPHNYPLGSKSSIEYKGGAFMRVGNINDAFPPNTRGLGYVAGGYPSSTRDAGSRLGDAWVYIVNLMSEALGVAVCLVECATGGQSIDYWMNGAAGWTNLTTNLAAVGGDCEGATLYQGESDSGMAYATYLSKLGTLQSQLHVATGRNAATFKMGIVSLGAVSLASSYSGASDTKTGKTRSAQAYFAHNTPGAFFAASNHDCKTSDGVHVVKDSYAALGPRIGQSAAAAYGLGLSGAGPHVTSATRSGVTVTVNLVHAGGTALLDGAGGNGAALTGHRFFDAGAADAQIAYTTSLIVGDTLQFTLASEPVGVLTYDYAMTNAPHSSDPTTSQTDPVFASCVYDNVPLINNPRGCPLQPCAAITVT